MVTDVTYNAITTDFWANLDLIGSRETWKMFGTGGDAKGQPTQTNSISHGSPYIRIKKIMHIYLGESAQPRRQEITQIMHMYQQSPRPRRQQFDQRGFVRPGSNHNMTGAGERFGNLRRQAKMPYRKSRFDNSGALCAGHKVFCTASRKMQDGVDRTGL